MDKVDARIKLREHLKTLIEENEIQNCFMTADETMEYPYTVLDIKEGNNEIYTPFYLEAETWNSGDNTAEIEKICDKLKSVLDNYRYVSDEFTLLIYFNDCVTNYDEDKDIKRRLQNFEIKMYIY